MSPAFILAFKKRFRCEHCSHQKLSGYSLCGEHLVRARKYWRTRVKRKMILGECINCQHKHVPGEQRCGTHKALNKERIHNWCQAKYYGRKREGLCVDCLIGVAEKAIPGTIRCQSHTLAARQRNRLRRKISRLTAD